MRILFVAKCDYSGLAEGICKAFTQLGHTTQIYDLKKFRKIDKYFFKEFSLSRLKSTLIAFNPDLIFVVAPFFVKLEALEVIKDFRLRSSALVFGWIGDKFDTTTEIESKKGIFDRLYYTDTGFACHLNSSTSAYLPLATDPDYFTRPSSAPKFNCTFVASRTIGREDFLKNSLRRVDVFGPGWKNALEGHRLRSGKISLKQTAIIYSNSHFVLNLKNEFNVVNGLNQRSFDPYTSMTPVLHDHVDDLYLNFEVGKEILAFKNIEEFHEAYDRALGDEEYRKLIGSHGYKKVMAHHTYKNRALKILSEL